MARPYTLIPGDTDNPLVAWMIKHNTTTSQLAMKLGIQQSVVWRWAAGERIPNLDSAFKIEAVTGIPVKTWRKAR